MAVVVAQADEPVETPSASPKSVQPLVGPVVHELDKAREVGEGSSEVDCDLVAVLLDRGANEQLDAAVRPNATSA
jgi:hypothetical protein